MNFIGFLWPAAIVTHLSRLTGRERESEVKRKLPFIINKMTILEKKSSYLRHIYLTTADSQMGGGGAREILYSQDILIYPAHMLFHWNHILTL